MTFFPSTDRRKFISKSSIPLLYNINIGLVVDDVLDTTILQNKYAQLIGSSPVLGGVLRSKKDTRKFSCGSTVDFEGRILDYDLASFLPFPWHGDGRPTIIHDDLPSIDGRFLFNASCDPKPVFRMRATILKDVSLLCFSFVHGLFDSQSGFDVIRYFCDLLSERPIPRFTLPPDTTGIRMSDRLRVPEDCELESQKPPRAMFVTRKIGLLRAKGYFMLAKMLESLGLSEKITHRLVHLSRPWVDEVRRKAQKELESAAGSTVQLTNTDIIAALYLKMFYRPRPLSQKPVDVIGPLNYRSFLEPVEASTYYTHNSIICLRCQLSEQQVQTESIARVAEKIRRATLEYNRPTAIKRELRSIEDRVLAPAVPKIRGSLKWGVPCVAPWTSFDYASLDFSGASHRDRKPSVVFVHPDISLIGGSPSSPFLVTVKDGSGGYWLRAGNTTSGWEAFDHCTSLKTLFCAIDK